MSTTPNGKSSPNPQADGENGHPERPELPHCIVRWLRGFHLHREKSKATDWITVTLTLLVAIAAVYSGWVFNGQLGSMEKQANSADVETRIINRHARQQLGEMQAQVDATNEEMRQDERAWLVPSVGPIPFKINQMVVIPIVVTNIGKTPARKYHAEFAALMVKNGETPDFDYSGKKILSTFEDTAGIIFPGQPVPAPFPMLRPEPNSKLPFMLLNESDLDQLQNEKLFLEVYGRISYEDIFHYPRWTHFCRVANPSTNAVVSLSAKKCTDYNDADSYQPN